MMGGNMIKSVKSKRKEFHINSPTGALDIEVIRYML